MAYVTSLDRTRSGDVVLGHDRDGRTLSTFAEKTTDNEWQPLGARRVTTTADGPIVVPTS